MKGLVPAGEVQKLGNEVDAGSRGVDVKVRYEGGRGEGGRWCWKGCGPIKEECGEELLGEVRGWNKYKGVL